jgi:NCS1 family nucleobase:cation symporter-1
MARDESNIYQGAMPSREGETVLEMHGMAPIPQHNRYGRLHRIFTVWFTPNLVPAGFFIGTLGTASYIGVGFALGVVCIVIGTVFGGLLVSILGTWGPVTGVGQIPLARLTFGKTVIIPGALQWLSTIAWDAINAIFGAQAIHILIHVPFWIGLLIILAMQGVLGFFGYEVMHLFAKWMSFVLGALFIIITVKLINVGNWHAPASAHGGPLVGGFILMTTISASFVISWGAYASDYSRYMRHDTSRQKIFWLTLAGVSLSSIWIEILGLAAASLVVQSTSGGIQHLLGGGLLGGAAMVSIWIGTVSVNAMNDYSGSLALQAAGARIRRPYIAVIVTVIAFFLTLWLNTGDMAAKFENVLLFATYWVPAFAAIQMVDWWRHRAVMDVSHIIEFNSLHTRLDALIAMGIGFAASIPFMDTSIFIGWASSHWLFYGDIAFVVGFVVAGVAYFLLRLASTKSVREPQLTHSPIR